MRRLSLIVSAVFAFGTLCLAKPEDTIIGAWREKDTGLLLDAYPNGNLVVRGYGGTFSGKHLFFALAADAADFNVESNYREYPPLRIKIEKGVLTLTFPPNCTLSYARSGTIQFQKESSTAGSLQPEWHDDWGGENRSRKKQ